MSATKLMLYHRRASGTSVAEWNAVWGRIFESLTESVRIVQNVPRRGEIEPKLDGIDEILLEQGADIERDVLRALDGLRPYCATGWPYGMLALERVQVPPTAAPQTVRRMAMVFRRVGLDARTFEHEWNKVHPTFVAPLSGLRGYVQAVRIAPLPGLAAPDGGSTLWWDSVEVCEAAYADQGPVGRAHVADMERLFARDMPTGTYCDAVDVLAGRRIR